MNGVVLRPALKNASMPGPLRGDRTPRPLHIYIAQLALPYEGVASSGPSQLTGDPCLVLESEAECILAELPAFSRRLHRGQIAMVEDETVAHEFIKLLSQPIQILPGMDVFVASAIMSLAHVLLYVCH